MVFSSPYVQSFKAKIWHMPQNSMHPSSRLSCMLRHNDASPIAKTRESAALHTSLYRHAVVISCDKCKGALFKNIYPARRLETAAVKNLLQSASKMP